MKVKVHKTSKPSKHAPTATPPSKPASLLAFADLERLANPTLQQWIDTKAHEYDQVTVVVNPEPLSSGNNKQVFSVPSDPDVIQKSKKSVGGNHSVESEARTMWKLNAFIRYIPHFAPIVSLQSNGTGPNVLLHTTTSKLQDATSIQYRLQHFDTFTTVNNEWPEHLLPATFTSMRLQLSILNHVLEGRVRHKNPDPNKYIFRRLTFAGRDYGYRIRWMDQDAMRFEFTVPCWMMITDLHERSIAFTPEGISTHATLPKKKRVSTPFTEMDKVLRNALDRHHIDMSKEECTYPPSEPYSADMDKFLNDLHKMAKLFERDVPILGTWTMYMDWSHDATFVPAML